MKEPWQHKGFGIHYCHPTSGGPKPKTFSAMMRTKIDSTKGRLIYNRRLGTAEPPFANIKSALGLDRFTLRGQKKVGTQWRLYCIVHNILKIHRYGEAFG